MVKIKYTTASAVKEKEGKLMCQAEVLCEGEITATRMAKVETVVLLYLCALKKKCLFQDSSCPKLTTTPTARGTALSTATASKSLRCQNR